MVNAVLGGCVEKEVADTAEDDESMFIGKGGSVWVEC